MPFNGIEERGACNFGASAKIQPYDRGKVRRFLGVAEQTVLAFRKARGHLIISSSTFAGADVPAAEDSPCMRFFEGLVKLLLDFVAINYPYKKIQNYICS